MPQVPRCGHSARRKYETKGGLGAKTRDNDVSSFVRDLMYFMIFTCTRLQGDELTRTGLSTISPVVSKTIRSLGYQNRCDQVDVCFSSDVLKVEQSSDADTVIPELGTTGFVESSFVR